MENQKTKIISIASIIALALTLVTATFAYFMAQTGEGKSTDIKINANTVDTFTFEAGSAISLNLNQDNFASGNTILNKGTINIANYTFTNDLGNESYIGFSFPGALNQYTSLVYFIDWGDGTSDYNSTEHIYKTSGTYTIKFYTNSY